MKKKYNVNMAVKAHVKITVDAGSPEEAEKLADELIREKLKGMGWRYPGVTHKGTTAHSVLCDEKERPEIFDSIYAVDFAEVNRDTDLPEEAFDKVKRFLGAGRLRHGHPGLIAKARKCFPQYDLWALRKAIEEWETLCDGEDRRRTARYVKYRLRVRGVRVSDCGNDAELIAKAKGYIEK